VARHGRSEPAPAWRLALPAREPTLINAVVRMPQGAKQSQFICFARGAYSALCG